MRRRRKAFTLVELLTAMAILSAVFGSMLLTLYAMQKSGRRFSDGIDASVQLERFASQLRADAHKATDASILRQTAKRKAASVLEMKLDAGVVQYRLTERRIERIEKSGAKTLHRESYAVLPVLEPGWAIDDSRPVPLVTILLHQVSANGSHQDNSLEPASVNAAVGVSVVSSAAEPTDE